MSPVELQNRYDLVLGQANDRTTMFSKFSPLATIRLTDGMGPEWSDGGLRELGLAGFNDTRLRPGAREILSIEGRPLLVTGSYGQGRTVAFTGFTPPYLEHHAEWDSKVILPYQAEFTGLISQY